jgi:hypothetical protein
MFHAFTKTRSRRTASFVAIPTALALGVYIFKARRETSSVSPNIQPDGAPKSVKTTVLEVGAKVLQAKEPLRGFNNYLVGFHPMSESPCHQMEAHHYCKQVNEEFAQCILTDGNTENANVTGLEYIISERLFNTLSAEEQKFWHPHNYEIFSGQLVGPGLPTVAEKELMKTKVNSYGKTVHTWRAKCWEGNQPYLDTLPKGEPLIAWSFNHDGEMKPELLAERDHNLSWTDTEAKRAERQDLVRYAHPQKGVNRLRPFYKDKQLAPTPGVVDAEAAVESSDASLPK